jgi:hypothetical protein
MLQVVVGEAWPIELQLGDGDTGKFPQAEVCTPGVALPIATLDLAHLAGGRYANTYTFIAGNFEVRYVVYSDAAHTSIDYDYQIVLEDVVSQVNDLDSLPAAFMATLVGTTYNLQQYLRIIAAAVAGKASGGPGSPVFRDVEDASNVITGTADSSGNRTASVITP